MVLGISNKISVCFDMMLRGTSWDPEWDVKMTWPIQLGGSDQVTPDANKAMKIHDLYEKMHKAFPKLNSFACSQTATNTWNESWQQSLSYLNGKLGYGGKKDDRFQMDGSWGPIASFNPHHVWTAPNIDYLRDSYYTPTHMTAVANPYVGMDSYQIARQRDIERDELFRKTQKLSKAQKALYLAKLAREHEARIEAEILAERQSAQQDGINSTSRNIQWDRDAFIREYVTASGEHMQYMMSVAAAEANQRRADRWSRQVAQQPMESPYHPHDFWLGLKYGMSWWARIIKRMF